MQSGYTGHITPTEWRWVLVIGSALILIAFVPFVWVLLSGSAESQWQFMGAIHAYQNGAAYLAKVVQGESGALLIHFQHTPEPHNALFMQLIYPLLGQISRLISTSPIIVFHVARLGATLIMYMAIYQLAASIWMRIRTRRLFFILASFGSGLGWLVSAVFQDTSAVDLVAPALFPFQSSLVNVHFPLGIACSALLASIIITLFRPGKSEIPTANNGAPIAAFLSVVLALVYPEAAFIMVAAFAIYVAAYCITQRQLAMWAIYWLLVIALPAFPFLVVHAAFIAYSTVMGEWYRQIATVTPNLLMLVVGLGIPLVIALPGIARALRRFEPDGDQFMMIWLLVMLVAIYLPLNFQSQFAAGMMLPIAYFAARSLEDFWFQHTNRRWRYRLLALLLPVISLSNLLVLFAPIVPLVTNQPTGDTGIFLQREYRTAFDWLGEHTRSNDVVLASPNVGLWLPAWMNVRSVYGHPDETLDSTAKKQAVVDWYGLTDDADCKSLLEGESAFHRGYRVRYVIVGPQERALGSVGCEANLTFAASFGDVSIYIYIP
jgi:hypothetical protein